MRGEILELKSTINDGGSAERLRLSIARGAQGWARKASWAAGACPGRRHLEGPHRQRERDGREPDRSGAQHRQKSDPVAKGDLTKKIAVDVKEILELKSTINTMWTS